MFYPNTTRRCLLSSLVAAAGHSASSPAETILIKDVRIFDGNEILEPASIVIRDGRVASVGRKLQVAKSVDVISGRGRTLLPRLIECAEHVRQLEGESPFHNLMEVK